MFHKRWKPEMAIEHILSRVGKEPLYSHYYATHYPGVHAAAIRIYGSWKAAIAACGLDYERVRRYRAWSPERVIEEICELKRIHHPLSSKSAQMLNKALYMAALKRFGSWQKALSAAGVGYSEIRIRRHMTVEEIRAEILAIYRRGESLAYSNMRKNHQYLLAYGVKKLGNGSWNAARKACGIEDNFRAIGQANAFRRRDDAGEFVRSFDELALKSDD